MHVINHRTLFNLPSGRCDGGERQLGPVSLGAQLRRPGAAGQDEDCLRRGLRRVRPWRQYDRQSGHDLVAPTRPVLLVRAGGLARHPGLPDVQGARWQHEDQRPAGGEV